MMAKMVVDGGGRLNHTELMRRHLFLVEKIVRNFQGLSDSKEDLEGAGYIGLSNAANLYDRKVHKMDFESYARLLIIQEIHRYLVHREYEVDQPEWFFKLNRRILRFVKNYQKKHQKFPQISEIADHVDIKNSDLQEIVEDRESVKERYLIYQLSKETGKIRSELEKIEDRSRQNSQLPIKDAITLQKALLKLKELQGNIIDYIFIMQLQQTETVRSLGIFEGLLSQLKQDFSDRLSR